MTTYAYTIILDDAEVMATQAALELMIKHCQEKLDEGAGASYLAHKHKTQNILDKLYKNTSQTSGNHFFDREK